MSSAGRERIAVDSDLIVRVRSGDQAAMAVIYDRYSPLIYSIALRVLADRYAAEDVLQDVLLQLWRNPASFDAARGSLAAWLAVIARHRAIDRLRRRHPESDLDEIVIAVEPDLDSGAERTAAVARVRDALNQLPDPQRTALELAFFEGLTHTEIAERSATPLGTVKTRIRSGLAAIRKALQR